MKCKNCRNLVKRIDDDGTLYDFCGMVIDSPDTDRERNCKYYVVATNADRIRAMTDEGLAKQFNDIRTSFKCVICGDGKRCFAFDECEDCWLDWMKQEVKEK